MTLLDGADLGRAIAAHPDDIEAVRSAYKPAMFTRSAEPTPVDGEDDHGIDFENGAGQAVLELITALGS